MHQNQQYVDVAWRHAGDARGLSECLGIDTHELLSALGRNLVEFLVVEVSLDSDVFEAVHLVGYLSFAFDVAVVLDEYLGSLDYFVASNIVRIECSTEWSDGRSELLYGELRSGYQARYCSAELHWGCTERFESCVYVARLHVGRVAEVNDALNLRLLLKPMVVTFARGESETFFR